RDRRQLYGGRSEREVGDQTLPQPQFDTGPRLGGEPQGAYFDAVGPAHVDVLEQGATGGPRENLPTASIQGVGHANGSTRNRGLVFAHDCALKRSRRDALCRQQVGQECEGRQAERPPHDAVRSFWKRGWLRSRSQVGSMRSHGAVRCPGRKRRCSSSAMAASYSPTIV